jgi:hypothetical protein
MSSIGLIGATPPHDCINIYRICSSRVSISLLVLADVLPLMYGLKKQPLGAESLTEVSRLLGREQRFSSSSQQCLASPKKKQKQSSRYRRRLGNA